MSKVKFNNSLNKFKVAIDNCAVDNTQYTRLKAKNCYFKSTELLATIDSTEDFLTALSKLETMRKAMIKVFTSSL